MLAFILFLLFAGLLQFLLQSPYAVPIVLYTRLKTLASPFDTPNLLSPHTAFTETRAACQTSCDHQVFIFSWKLYLDISKPDKNQSWFSVLSNIA